MLADAPLDARVSTGLGALDEVLGGLYRGDNVVWRLDRAPVEPFFRAICANEAFESKTVVSLGAAVNTYGAAGLAFIDAGPNTGLAQPADLLREIRRRCQTPGRRLILFESLDSMARAWGPAGAREFFTRCCPLLLDVGAVAYWTMTARDMPRQLREAVEAVTQCVLHVDDRSVRVVKAEGRDGAVRGAVLHWRDEGGRTVLAPPEVADRVAASLRAVRRTRTLSQHDLGDLAGVTASAISQAERAERGLSLATLVRLSDALGVTVDDLVHGDDSVPYRIGRRSEDPRRGLRRTLTLLGGADADLRIDLVHLDAREAGEPAPVPVAGTAVVAVATGLVGIKLGSQSPVLRHGEVLVAAAARIEGWRNLGQSEAMLFWIVFAGSPR